MSSESPDRLSVIRSWYTEILAKNKQWRECVEWCHAAAETPHMEFCPVGMVGDLLARIDQLCGEPFSERVHVALRSQVADLSARVETLTNEWAGCRALFQESEHTRLAAEAEVVRLRALSAEKGTEAVRAPKARAHVLRRCAEEIENSLRNPVVSDRQLLRNCVNWYRAQADNLDPPVPASSQE